MGKLSDKAKHGLDVIASMMGQKSSDQLREMASSEAFGATVSLMATEFAFGTAWAHESLTRREKSLVTIGVLIALRQASELKNHVKIGVANGLTLEEIEGAMIQATPYVGFPAIATAGTAVIEALREIGRDPNVKTSEERGLL